MNLPRSLTAALAVIVTLLVVAVPASTTTTGNTYTNVSYYTTRQLISRAGVTLDPLPIVCNGGTIDIHYIVGDLEADGTPHSQIHLQIRLDGQELATFELAGDSGNYNDTPVNLEVMAPCPVGRHVVSAYVYSLDGWWGVPYADTGTKVPRGFIVSE